jgi:Primase C terminal 1 (PriCT-1)./Replicase family.
MAIINKYKETLPQYIKCLPEKGKPAIWLPQKHALAVERIKIYQNDRHFLMADYDSNQANGTTDHTHYDIEPNIICYNPANDNHQAFWRLEDPVYCQPSAQMSKPYLLLKAIERAFDDKYGLDKHFARYICRNALHAAVDTDWRHNKGYSLNELAEVVNLNTARIKKGNKAVKGKGRNCTVFDDLRFWAYNQDKKQFTYPQWQQRCYTQAVAYNAFEDPLPPEELIGIANSVARFTYNNEYNPADSFDEYVRKTHTSEIQAARGRKSAEKRWKDHVKQEPWIDMGISKATYYRRKKNGSL